MNTKKNAEEKKVAMGQEHAENALDNNEGEESRSKAKRRNML